jgi:sugar diacid utilization regulator
MAKAVATDLVADVLTARRDEFLAAAVEAFVERVPNAEPALVEDARRHVAQHHDLLCDVLRRGRAVHPQELDAQQWLVADGERVRRDLLEDLLEAGAPRTAAGLAAARAAGLEGDGRFVLVAAGALDGDGELSRAARTLIAAIRGGAEPLAVTRHGEIVLVRPCAPDEQPELRARLAEACERAASEGIVLAIGVSTVHRGLGAVGAAYLEASLAAGRVAAEGGVLSLPELSAFDYLTARHDETVRRLVPARIARFVSEDRAHGGHLIKTLVAYAEADMNAKVAAERLLIHVNTAHYRLGRIAEKTGCDLRRLADVIDLLIAVRMVDP